MTPNWIWVNCDEGLPDRCHVVIPGLPPGANVAVCAPG